MVIGGVGGSGTRIVADMVRGLGTDLGNDLNDSSDNLWATLLLRRPVWYRENRLDGGHEIDRALTVLERTMNGRLEVDAAVEHLLEGASHELREQGLSEAWTRARIKNMIERRSSGAVRTSWGWKEPNSHVYVEFIARHFTDALYVHVIRHGLDMAFSTNQWQVRTWGWLFGITTTDIVDPATSLDYWLKANQAAMTVAARTFGPRFLLVDYDALCVTPEREARRIASFVGAEPSSAELTRVAGPARAPYSSGRWRRFGIDPFRPDQLADVAALGFEVD